MAVVAIHTPTGNHGIVMACVDRYALFDDQCVTLEFIDKWFYQMYTNGGSPIVTYVSDLKLLPGADLTDSAYHRLSEEYTASGQSFPHHILIEHGYLVNYLSLINEPMFKRYNDLKIDMNSESWYLPKSILKI